MERTWLVQRLQAPLGGKMAAGWNDFATMGGFNKKAGELLAQVYNFDYMGSSEFEFGAIPKSFQRIANYSRKGDAVVGAVSLTRPVHYVCDRTMQKGVESIIQQLAQNKLRLQEPTFFERALAGDEFAVKYKGWLELNNDFMFFVDGEMYDNTLNLFGIGQPKNTS